MEGGGQRIYMCAHLNKLMIIPKSDNSYSVLVSCMHAYIYLFGQIFGCIESSSVIGTCIATVSIQGLAMSSTLV